MDREHVFEIKKINEILKQEPTKALENGKIVFLPSDGFFLEIHEQSLLNEKILAPKEKNISYQYNKKKLSGVSKNYLKTPIAEYTALMMHRYTEYALDLISQLFPNYRNHLKIGRTCFGPPQIKNQQLSLLNDDTKLHIDAFSSSPVQGQRILTVFTNINPHQKPRVWHVGESFESVLNQFESSLQPYNPWKSHLMNIFGFTQSKRTAYDHFMLQLHDNMKLNQKYQNEVDKCTIEFPSESTWIVYTDQVSHAALDGQYLLEQTFYLPIEAMEDKANSPLYQFQSRMPQQKLI